MNTNGLTDFSWSRHQISSSIASGVVKNGGIGTTPHASHQQSDEKLRRFHEFEGDFMYLLL